MSNSIFDIIIFGKRYFLSHYNYCVRKNNISPNNCHLFNVTSYIIFYLYPLYINDEL